MRGVKKILIFVLIILLILTGINVAISDNTSKQITSTNQTIAESCDSTDETLIHQKIEETNANFALAPLNPEFLEYQNRTASKDVLLYVEMTGDGHALGLIPHPVDISHLGDIDVASPYLGYSESYDLRSQGRVTPVGDQGSAGNCWAFATYASLESYLLPTETWNFSENNMKNLLSSSYPDGFDREHYDGGNHFKSTAYLARWSGPINESDDPYISTSDVSPSGLSATKHVQDVLFVPDRDNFLDNDNIKWAIENYGAVYSSMYIHDDDYDSTNHTFYYDGTYNANHAIAIVGWNDSFDKNKFSSVPPGNGAFIIKNSWGTGWGENGYFYISYYDSVIGSKNAIFTTEALNNYDYVYQYDPLGWVTSFGYNDVTAWAANIFTAESSESLEAISFYTTDSNVEYELYIYRNPDSGPINSSGYIGTKTGTISLAGYHTISLNSGISIDPGQKFSAVVKFTNPSFIFPIAIELPKPDFHSTKATANTGEGYFSLNGVTWTDITEIYDNTSICIKAFTKENNPPDASGEIPSNDPRISNTTPLISVNITDNASGVNVSSIVMTVNDSIVEISNIPIAAGYMVYNQTVVPFADNQLINVSVNASDNASNSMTYNWSFTVDGDAPLVTNPNANPGTIESDGIITTNLSVFVTDSFSGINSVSMNLSAIGGSPTAAMTNSGDTYYIITNATGVGNDTYSLLVSATDNAGNSNTSVNITLSVNDTTPPILSDKIPLSGTNSTTPTISINATDRGSGINASSAEMKVEGEQVILKDTSSGFTFNFTNTTTTTYNHGDTVNVTFNVSDNEGHTTNTSWMFYIDTAAPTITTTSPADGYSTTESSVQVTGTVNGTGSPPTVTVNDVIAEKTINSTVFNGTFIATAYLSVNANTIFANVTDAAGNTISTVINVTRTPASLSGGGGGGGGGTSGEDFYNIAETVTQRVSIFKDDNVSYSFKNTQNPIQNIEFSAKVSAGKVASKIEVLRNTSTMVDTPAPGKVYQNINIWVGNYGWASENNIKDMTISFTVPLDWITSNNIDESSIALYRYNGDSWERLPTSLTTRNENSITFTSSTPGFSPFAISGETVSTPAVIPTAHDAPTAVATYESNNASNSQTNVNEPGNKESTIMLWILFIIVILAVTVIIFMKKDEILQGINNMRQQRGR